MMRRRRDGRGTRAFRWAGRVFLALLVVALSWPASAPASAQVLPRPLYTIEADVDVDNGVVDAVETVRFRNATGDTLTDLVFHVTPANYRAFTLASATVNGTAVTARRDRIVLTVPLLEPLAPGEEVNVRLAFRLDVPSPGTNRFGHARGIFALGNWYPVLAIYRDGWDRHQYTEVGDAFVTEIADYAVTVRLSRAATVAHSGTAGQVEATRIQLTGESLRDFALAISARYVTRQIRVDGVLVRAHVLPEHAAAADEFLRTGGEVVRWGARRLGGFPHRQLDIAETISDNPNWVGQEYPGLIFISSIAIAGGGGIDSYLSYLIAHEVVHQWFYGVVGSDQVREPWTDEAFATYLSYRFYADNYPAVFGQWMGRARARWADARRRLGDRPINTGVFDYASEDDYFAVVYRRGAIFLDDLHGLLGDAEFFALCREFVASRSGTIARGVDFLREAQERGGSPVSALIQQHFRYPELDTPAASATNWPIAGGRFYTEANGRGGEGRTGYAVTNDGGVRFWDEFQRLGGVQGLGYPASHRFTLDGFTVQVFQKSVLQWRPEVGQAYFLNVLDRLSEAGRDDWLAQTRLTPPPSDTGADAGLTWSAVIDRHVAPLAAVPALRTAYLAAPDWLDRYGLPMAVADYPDVRVVRGQRAVLQQWKSERPWARAGEITVANGGDLFKEAGLVPASATDPAAPP